MAGMAATVSIARSAPSIINFFIPLLLFLSIRQGLQDVAQTIVILSNRIEHYATSSIEESYAQLGTRYPYSPTALWRFLAHVMPSYGVLHGSTSLQPAIEIPSLRGAWNRNEGSLCPVLWNQEQGLVVAHHKVDFAVKRPAVAFDECVTSHFEVLQSQGFAPVSELPPAQFRQPRRSSNDAPDTVRPPAKTNGVPASRIPGCARSRSESAVRPVPTSRRPSKPSPLRSPPLPRRSCRPLAAGTLLRARA